MYAIGGLIGRVLVGRFFVRRTRVAFARSNICDVSWKAAFHFLRLSYSLCTGVIFAQTRVLFKSASSNL